MSNITETQEDYNMVSEAMWNADPSIPEAEQFKKVTTEELTEEQRELAKNLAGWKNSLYEAVMSDYSVTSINRAEAGRNAAEAAIEAEGIDPDSVVVWSEDRGCYTVA